MIREDLKLSDNLLDLYENINYYNRYKTLSEKYMTEGECLEKTDKKEVLKILEELGYTAKYIGKEKFYQIKETYNEKNFYFHVSLKYGLVELIFGLLNDSVQPRNKTIGGTAAGTCKLIEMNKGQLTDGFIKDPRFRTYEELREILKESLLLYEDLKKEVIKGHL